MQEFDYVALDAQGRRQRAVLVAGSEALALAQIQQRGLTVIALAPHRATGERRGPRGRTTLSAEQLGALLHELAMLVEAGVPLAEAVATLASSQPPGHALAQMLARLRGGEAFSEALAGSGLRPPVFVLQLVRAGESTGELPRALRAAAEHLEAEEQFAREARNALLYPAVLVGSGVLATLVMFIFVVPKFAGILSNPKADLPWISQLVLGLGLWLTQHQVVVGLALAAAVALGASLAGRPWVREAAWELAARMPVLGRWSWHAEMARWSSLLAVLLNSRVPLLTSLAQANETLRRRSLRLRAQLVLAEVRGGKSLSQALSDHAVLDPAGLNLLRVGERAGTLGQTVAALARTHTLHSQQRLKRLLVLLEPVTILVISVVLGGIMISVMLAITSLTNVL